MNNDIKYRLPTSKLVRAMWKSKLFNNCGSVIIIWWDGAFDVRGGKEYVVHYYKGDSRPLARRALVYDDQI